MRIFTPSVALGAALIFSFSGGTALGQDQPAAGAPPQSATSPTQSLDTQAPPPPDMQAPQSGVQFAPPDPARQARMMAKKLSLTPDQQAQIEPIIADRQQQIQSVRSDTTLAPKEMRARVRGINQDSDSKIEAILSDTQRQQYEQLKAEQKAKRQQQREQQNGAAPPPPDNQ